MFVCAFLCVCVHMHIVYLPVSVCVHVHVGGYMCTYMYVDIYMLCVCRWRPDVNIESLSSLLFFETNLFY